ncbi:3-keto-disaccharide hydrolase [Fimbriiglobus ruber]|uniref:Putative secreted glycosyl hydrolase n=1 Tax=Fimbriiglobus ruber TaxID=1908690 RepID=A0A225D098_9BACT|nr:DUF1080 domain-containing protein [Fimbriiglobus ruber]OWK35040.1 putative secreted glycosyl hydrolase [Fimbriiglobus ruber]
MMRRFLLSGPVAAAAIGIALATAGTTPAADEPTAPPKGFTPVFNGKDLDGWHGWAIHDKAANPYDMAKLDDEARAKKIEAWTADAKKHWTVENGELVNDGHGAYLATDKDYGDIELLIDYKTVPKADSGIYMRATPQVQIWDYTDKAKFNIGSDKGSGGLWNNSAGAPGKDPLVLADKAFGEWNHFRIIQVGARTTVYLNDKLVVNFARMENYWDRGQPLLKKAPILLQTHGGEIRWRNIYAREIPAAEANEMLAKHESEGFTSIFDGKTFDGWQGATANYEIVDGAVRCKPHKGGVLYTKEEYADFQVALEIKLPKNGNNGLGIRYPGGTGDGAYIGMCELQVLDDAYAGIDPRQAHGSAYGMVAAKRGFQRPIGEWNYQLVTVKGPTIKVELNGFLILDCDLSKVDKFMANSPHPGKDRKSGFFGFLGHNDPVEFRNVKIKKLETSAQ